GIGQGDRDEGHEPRAVDHGHLLRDDDLTRQGVIGRRAYHQPEPGGFGLLRRTLGAGLPAIFLDLVVIGSPLRAAQPNRRGPAGFRRPFQRGRRHVLCPPPPPPPR